MIKKINILQFIDEHISARKWKISKIDIPNFIAYESDINDLLSLLSFIKSSHHLRFTLLTDLFASDFPDRDKRFEIVYQILSLEFNKRLLIKVMCGIEEKMPSITKIFNVAEWYEREVYDMFGVEFKNHPNLSRILTDYGFIGHPLRKDFPLIGHVQARYDESLQRVIYESVKLDQEFRTFNFSSPWNGPEYLLPGDEKATK